MTHACHIRDMTHVCHIRDMTHSITSCRAIDFQMETFEVQVKFPSVTFSVVFCALWAVYFRARAGREVEVVVAGGHWILVRYAHV